MTALETQFKAMHRLQENWDGYGTAPPQTQVIELASEFGGLIEALRGIRTAAPRPVHVSATRTGGILIEWVDGDMQHEMEINHDQSLAFLHFNTMTGQIETRQFSPGTRAVMLFQFLQVQS